MKPLEKRGEIYAIDSTAGVYVGSALGSSLTRWAGHIRLLKDNRHHCKALQVSFTGVECLAFRVLETGIPNSELFRREIWWNRKLNAISAPPGVVVREEVRDAVLADIRAKVPYRTIAAKYGMSLGNVARLKAQYGDQV